MSEFTEGTWKTTSTYSTFNSPNRYWETTVRGQQGVVAVACGASEEEARELGRFISAAPDMYEALRILMPLIHGEIKRGGGLFSDGNLEAVEAALTKADGTK